MMMTIYIKNAGHNFQQGFCLSTTKWVASQPPSMLPPYLPPDAQLVAKMPKLLQIAQAHTQVTKKSFATQDY